MLTRLKRKLMKLVKPQDLKLRYRILEIKNNFFLFLYGIQKVFEQFSMFKRTNNHKRAVPVKLINSLAKSKSSKRN